MGFIHDNNPETVSNQMIGNIVLIAKKQYGINVRANFVNISIPILV